jgi:hypothetical protein
LGACFTSCYNVGEVVDQISLLVQVSQQDIKEVRSTLFQGCTCRPGRTIECGRRMLEILQAREEKETETSGVSESKRYIKLGPNRKQQ